MNRKIVLLGFYVGDEYFDRYSKGDPYPQVAAYKLEGRFLDALHVDGNVVTAIASIAVTTYPRNKRICFPAAKVEGAWGRGVVIPLVNFPLVKMLSRLSGSIINLFRLRKANVDWVCVYAAHTPNLVAAYIGAKLLGVPYFVYIPDLPVFMDMGVARGKITRLLKKIDSWLIDIFISGGAGVFVASKYMVTDSAKWSGKPFLVLEGIANSVAMPSVAVEADVPKEYIFYAGGLSKAYGIVELVEGFIKANTKFELWLCGRGELELYLSEVSERHPSIKYLGFLSPREVERVQATAAGLIMNRNPHERYTRYSFPSKLLEYMVSGIPILTTRLDGIPEEYFEHLNVIDDPSSEGISSALVAFGAMDRQILSKKAACARIWVLENKTSSAVGRKIVNFMEMHN